MLVRSSRPPATTRLGTHRVSRLLAGVTSSFPGLTPASHPSHSSHPSHCLNFFGGCAATSPSLRSLNLCLSLGDGHDSSEAVEDHGRGHGKGPCGAIGAILKRHASTCLDIGAILKRRRRELQSDYWPKRTLETGGLTRERELQSDYWTISRLDHPRLTRSLSKTSSTS